MKKTKVTQSVIASQLNLSRNTVSKVLNNIEGVPEKTKQLVLSKASELGYRHVNSDAVKSSLPSNIPHAKTIDIAFVCHKNSVSGSFFTAIIRGIQEKLSESNARLRIIMLSDSNLSDCILPDSLSMAVPNAIITAGTFSKEYYLALQSLNCPTISLDTHPDLVFDRMVFDIVLVDNMGGSYAMTKHLIEKGHKQICFAGNIESCLSFHERWQGFNLCMQEFGLPVEPDKQLISLPAQSYFNCDEIERQLKTFDKLPTAFVCANDDTAKTFLALQNPPYSFLPADVSVTGFDNITEYFHFLSHCSTVEIHTHDIGLTVAEQVMWRISHPKRQYQTIRLAVSPVFR